MASKGENGIVSQNEAQSNGLESNFEGLEKVLTDIQKVAELEPVVKRIEEAFKRIENIQDDRSTSIKIGTGTRHQAKIYFDPTQPEEAREIIETAVDMLEIGQTMIEEAKEGDE